MRTVIVLLMLLTAACVSAPSGEPEAAGVTDDALRQEQGEGVQYCMTAQQVSEETERCLVIVEGKVYDLTELPVWGWDRPHKGDLKCGQDHTSALASMPHGRNMFESYFVAELCP